MTSPAEAVRARLRSHLASATAARETGTVRVLRALIAAIDNAEAVAVDDSGPYKERAFGDPDVEIPRRKLDEAAVAAVIEADAAERDCAAAQLRAADRPERAAELESEAAMVRRFLAG